MLLAVCSKVRFRPEIGARTMPSLLFRQRPLGHSPSCAGRVWTVALGDGGSLDAPAVGHGGAWQRVPGMSLVVPPAPPGGPPTRG